MAEPLTQEEELDLYRRIVVKMPLALSIWRLEDPQGDPGSLRLVASNSLLSQITGIQFENLVGTTVRESLPTALETEGPHAYVKAIRTGEPQILPELRWYGQEVIQDALFAVRAVPLGDDFVGIFAEDITERRLAEKAARERSDELRALFEIADVLAQPGSFTEQVERVLAAIRRISDTDTVDLRLPEDDGEGLRIVASVGAARTVVGTIRPFNDSRTGLAYRRKKPVISHDYAGSHRGRGARDVARYRARSVAWIPIRAGGRAVGVVALDSKNPDHFAKDRVKLLVAIADGLGPLLERARFEEAERTQSRKIDALYHITEALASESLEEGVRAALESVRALVGLRGCALWVPDMESKELHRFAEAHVGGPRVGAGTLDFHESGTTGRAYLKREPVIENDYPTTAHAKRSGKRDGTRAAASFPLTEQGQVIAVVTYLSDRSHAFDEPTLALLRATTESLGSSFGRGRLRQIEQRHTETLQALHSIARVLAEPGAFVDQVTAVLEEVKTVLEVDSADLRMPDAEDRAPISQ